MKLMKLSIDVGAIKKKNVGRLGQKKGQAEIVYIRRGSTDNILF